MTAAPWWVVTPSGSLTMLSADAIEGEEGAVGGASRGLVLIVTDGFGARGAAGEESEEEEAHRGK